jgi:transcriptional regulator with XRE-family HTH domain
MTPANTDTLPTRKRYKFAREFADLTQGQLAAMIGVARATVGEWEAGRTEPAFSKLVLLAELTNQPLDWFAEGLIVDGVRPKRLELPTFWMGAKQEWALAA